MGQTKPMKHCATGSLAGGGNTGWRSLIRLCKNSKKIKRLLRPWNIAKVRLQNLKTIHGD